MFIQILAQYHYATRESRGEFPPSSEWWETIKEETKENSRYALKTDHSGIRGDRTCTVSRLAFQLLIARKHPVLVSCLLSIHGARDNKGTRRCFNFSLAK